MEFLLIEFWPSVGLDHFPIESASFHFPYLLRLFWILQMLSLFFGGTFYGSGCGTLCCRSYLTIMSWKIIHTYIICVTVIVSHCLTKFWMILNWDYKMTKRLFTSCCTTFCLMARKTHFSSWGAWTISQNKTKENKSQM
jgi:hypothetical protein